MQTMFAPMCDIDELNWPPVGETATIVRSLLGCPAPRRQTEDVVPMGLLTARTLATGT